MKNDELYLRINSDLKSQLEDLKKESHYQI